MSGSAAQEGPGLAADVVGGDESRLAVLGQERTRLRMVPVLDVRLGDPEGGVDEDHW
jgi:hypothetical protein